MRTFHKILLGSVGTALVASAAIAASHEHVMTVKLTDGEVAHIAYIGDTAPKVQIVQGEPQWIAFGDYFSTFAQMDRISAMMDARFGRMMHEIALMEQRAAAMPSGAPQMVTFANVPHGTAVRYSYSSTTIGADGCARTVSWSSDGSQSAQPKMVETSSGSCAGTDHSRPKPVVTADYKKPDAATHRI